ncbi:hypothetical protein [Roseibium sp.]|uniref:hypothetical protein n=1 Tax=Roseibium sp. TaxID=1936156 RepID=UPI003BB16E11
MATTKPSADDRTSAHIYFAVPLTGNADEFSGQYLRLEEYIGTNEDSHLPSSVSAGGLTGISMSANGVFLLNADQKKVETFGKALTEKVLGGDHTVTVDKGDWKLKAKDGSITIEARNTTADANITLQSEGHDLHLYAVWGKCTTSDSRDIKESSSKKVTYVQLFEYSSVFGASITDRSAFSFSLNVVGDAYFKLAEAKASITSLKIIFQKYSGYYACFNILQVLSFKMAQNYRKTMVLYNKMTVLQIYVEMLKSQNDIVKSKIKGGVTETYAAEMRSKMAGCGVFQRIKF